MKSKFLVAALVFGALCACATLQPKLNLPYKDQIPEGVKSPLDGVWRSIQYPKIYIKIESGRIYYLNTEKGSAIETDMVFGKNIKLSEDWSHYTCELVTFQKKTDMWAFGEGLLTVLPGDVLQMTYLPNYRTNLNVQLMENYRLVSIDDEQSYAAYIQTAQDKKKVAGNLNPPAPADATPQAKQEPLATDCSLGTGFAVSPDGLIVSARHVINGKSRIEVMSSDGVWTQALLVRSSSLNDAALIRIKKQTPHFLKLGNSGAINEADKVYTFGFPVSSILGVQPKYSEGCVSAVSGIADDDTLMQISVPIQPGNSGGPLINTKGEVIGMITSTAAAIPYLKATGALPQNINWAIKSNYIAPLIEKDVSSSSLGIRDKQAVKKTVFLIRAW